MMDRSIDDTSRTSVRALFPRFFVVEISCDASAGNEKESSSLGVFGFGVLNFGVSMLDFLRFLEHGVSWASVSCSRFLFLLGLASPGFLLLTIFCECGTESIR